jgi:hypothetical protein
MFQLVNASCMTPDTVKNCVSDNREFWTLNQEACDPLRSKNVNSAFHIRGS